jgi:tetratricopeptide (TPR) repeat protein
VSDAAGRWARLSTLFDEAREIPAPDREGWLSEHVRDDPTLRDELRRMLSALDRDGPLDTAPTPPPPARMSGSGQAIAHRLTAALGDRYVIEDEIGRGGMGAIFRAHELKHDRAVILKVLRPDVVPSIGRQRFEAEVRIAAQLAHPHIIPLLDSGEADGLLYFVMPRIPGETLRERLDRVEKFSVRDAISILRDIADALFHAHEAGVVHRDLKPENILCSGDHAFLLDFGIAQWTREGDEGASRLTHDGVAIGTPKYMAPEQAAGRLVDHRADIYAWGLVASEMLLGSRDGDLDLAPARPDVPEALAALIYRSLTPEPTRRTTSAGTLVAALDAISSGVPTATPEVATPAVAARSARWPWLLGGAVAAAAVAFGAWRAVRVPAVVNASDLRMPIAVVPFRTESAASGSDARVRGRLAAAWITQGLEETQLFQVVPWSGVLAVVEGEEDAASAVRAALNPGTIVSGTFFETADALALTVQIRETRRGTLIVSLEPVSVPRDSVALAIRLVRERVMGALAARRDARFTNFAAVLERPPTFESFRAFDRAVTEFNAQRYRQSLDGFRAAFATDTSFIPPLVYAAQAAWNTTQVAVLDTLLAHLESRRGELTDYHADLTQYIRAVRNGEGEAAYAAASRAAAIVPDSRAAYDAALAALRLGRADEALARLERLSPDRGEMRGWPSYWTNLAHARHLGGDFDGDLAAAREMRRRHPTLRVAWTLEARAQAARHDVAAIDSLVRAADGLPAETYWSLAALLVVAGDELAAHGDTANGLRYHRRAEEWLRVQRRASPAYVDHIYWLGSALHSLGRYREARDAFRELARVSPDRLSSPELAAISAERAGDRGAVARAPQPPVYERGTMLSAEARVAFANGDAELGRARIAEALRVGYRSWPWWHSTGWRELAGVATGSGERKR